MAVKAVKPTSLGFNLIPREIKRKNGQTSIKLAAVLSPIFHLPTAELVASVKHHKTEFSYSGALKKFMKDMAIDKASMKPLETYLKAQVKLAMKSPALPIAMLNGYLENGITPNFTVVFEETLTLAEEVTSWTTLTEASDSEITSWATLTEAKK